MRCISQSSGGAVAEALPDIHQRSSGGGVLGAACNACLAALLCGGAVAVVSSAHAERWGFPGGGGACRFALAGVPGSIRFACACAVRVIFFKTLFCGKDGGILWCDCEWIGECVSGLGVSTDFITG